MDWNRAAKERLRYVRVSLAGDGDSESVTALDAALDEIKRLERHKLWMEETSESEEDGWCPTHPRRFAVNARDDGDECQVCRAESAERELQAQRERAQRAEERVRNLEAAHELGTALIRTARERADRHAGAIEVWQREAQSAQERADRLEAESLRYYHADGTYELLASATEVVERRKAAAKRIATLEEQVAANTFSQEAFDILAQRCKTLEAALRDTDATLDDSEYTLLLDWADGHQNRYRDNAIATLRAARRLIRAALAAWPAQEVK